MAYVLGTVTQPKAPIAVIGERSPVCFCRKKRCGAHSPKLRPHALLRGLNHRIKGSMSRIRLLASWRTGGAHGHTVGWGSGGDNGAQALQGNCQALPCHERMRRRQTALIVGVCWLLSTQAEKFRTTEPHDVSPPLAKFGAFRACIVPSSYPQTCNRSEPQAQEVQCSCFLGCLCWQHLQRVQYHSLGLPHRLLSGTLLGKLRMVPSLATETPSPQSAQGAAIVGWLKPSCRARVWSRQSSAVAHIPWAQPGTYAQAPPQVITHTQRPSSCTSIQTSAVGSAL